MLASIGAFHVNSAGLAANTGIVTKEHIHPESDLRGNLGYKTGDIRELIGLIARDFSIELSADHLTEFTTIDQTLKILNQQTQDQQSH
ncbi:hypothetical protein GCM10028807_25340 [Spirosoma daeguense]